MPSSKKLFQRLCYLHSFVIPKDRHVFSKRLLTKDEKTMGVYVNSFDNFIVFSTSGLHWVHDRKVRLIKFSALKAVELPDDEEHFELLLTFHDNSTLTLPIFNETEGQPDFWAIHEYLVSVIYWPHQSWHPESIRDIHSLSDLYQFLMDQEEGWERHSIVLDALRDEFPKTWQLKYFDIDPMLLEIPDVWRLLALFLSREPEEIEDIQGYLRELPYDRYSFSSESFFLIGEDSQEDSVLSEPNHQTTTNSSLDLLPSADAVQILELAEREALALGQNCITPLSILLGLVAFDFHLSREFLELSEAFTIDKLRAFVNPNPVEKEEQEISLELTPTANKLLLKAFQYAELAKSKWMRPEHLLAAIKSEDSGVIAAFLAEFRSID